jgi:hypothetical protein
MVKVHAHPIDRTMLAISKATRYFNELKVGLTCVCPTFCYIKTPYLSGINNNGRLE